jgi:predicted molibdopterin-dependent oxidoreductase YjgC
VEQVKEVMITINGKICTAPEGSTILEAARINNIEIPTLCFLKEINEIGACRMCVVEVKGARSLVTACVYPVTEGMEITTNSKKVFDSRRVTLELILSTHERNVFPVSAAAIASCKSYVKNSTSRMKTTSTAKTANTNLMTVPCIWSETTISVFFAAVASPRAQNGRLSE